MTELIELETERLRLRQWIESDREPFARLCADPRVMEFYPNILDRTASDAMVDRLQALIADRGWGLWAVELKADNQFIGYVGLHVPKVDLPCSPCVEIGWRLAFPYWGKGYATEAARGALKVGFDRLNLPEIVSFTATINRRSRAVMERLGMDLDADTFEHPIVPAGQILREHVLYRLSRDRWQSDRERVRQFFKSSRWENIQIGIYIITFLLLSPVLIPIACLLGFFDDRQKNKAANRFPCTNCGQILGTISIELANTEQHEFMQRLMRENPGMKIRPADRTTHAICGNCGTKFTYLEKDRLFKLNPESSTVD